jgi:hypothetical protein
VSHRKYNPWVSLALDALILQIEDEHTTQARRDRLRQRKGRLELRHVPTRRPRR